MVLRSQFMLDVPARPFAKHGQSVPERGLEPHRGEDWQKPHHGARPHPDCGAVPRAQAVVEKTVLLVP